MGKPPLQARRRFFIILGAHQMQKEAANALLKMLEEPQARTTFVLTTDSPGFLLDTIRSRCQTVRFGAIPEPAMRAWLRENAGAPEPELDLAVLLSAGSLGGALRFLEDKASFLSAPVVDYFAGRAGSGEKAVLDTLDAVKDAAPVAVVGTYIFLYREALKSRLGITSPFAGVNPGVFRGTENADPAHLRRALKYLLNRAPEAGLSIAPRLFNYTLLSVLRPPGSR
jgi:DNA polymerase-3 subunit delta'